MKKYTLHEMANVYGALADEVSKDIFINRLNYNITQSASYINQIVKNDVEGLECAVSLEDLKQFTKLVNGRSKGRKILVYGAGITGRFIYDTLCKELDVECFCDVNESLQKEGMRSIPVLSPEEGIRRYAGKAVVILAVWPEVQVKVRELFMGQGFQNEDLIDSMQFFHPECLDEQQYFEPELMNYEMDEVFLDVGSYDLSTSLRLIKKTGGVKRIYAFEPDAENHRKCLAAIRERQLSNVTLVEAGAWSSSGVVKFNAYGGPASSIIEEGEQKIEVAAIDDVIKDTVTFIKMDIEGAELEALKGAEGTIKRDKPKLAICVYHKPEDLMDIPLFLKRIVPEYRLYLRHYMNTAGDTVLYAVCSEEFGDTKVHED